MKKKNVVLFDSSIEEAKEFIEGLEEATDYQWIPIIYNSNKGRNKFTNIVRYIKYFTFPARIFLKRKRYDIIIGWQEFYGLIFAFYCRLFHVRKENRLIIKNFIYNPKKGFIGHVYFKFMNYIVKSEYVDVYICASKTMVDYCCETFNEPKEKFVFIPFGVRDYFEEMGFMQAPTNDYILSLGRSNRDWDFLIKSFKSLPYNLKIVCDTLKENDVPKNVEILNDVWGDRQFEYIYNCKCMVIPIDNGKIASGDTVLLTAMSFSKPSIITKPSCLADDYVEEGYNGIVINKNSDELEMAIKKVFENKELYDELATNSRKFYLEKHSLHAYGNRVGEKAVGMLNK
ncbi:MAG: glycosyltransferase family 4 protein [Lachnospiraceae bacterium]|nr:glycosyltransferase family 4 protein [Lachnospiraceae bacterium]